MTDATITAPTVAATPTQSALADIWKQFRVHKGGVAGLFVFIFILLAVYVGPYIHTVAPNAINVKARNQWPSLAHPFGTDNLGKDMLAQVLAGGRISLAVGITAMLLALFLGTLVGVLSGYFRRLDGPLMRLTDLFLALPLLPLLLVIYAAYYIMPLATGIAFPPFATGLVALALNVSAYNGETFRAGIASIRKGQSEAALALGMSEAQAMREVILPQAARRVLPVLASTWVSLFKDTSLVSVIAVGELAYTALRIRSQSFRVKAISAAMEALST